MSDRRMAGLVPAIHALTGLGLRLRNVPSSSVGIALTRRMTRAGWSRAGGRSVARICMAREAL
jgi:hypothetical protein